MVFSISYRNILINDLSDSILNLRSRLFVLFSFLFRLQHSRLIYNISNIENHT